MAARVKPCVLDTMVLRKANAPLTTASKEGRKFAKRVALLRSLQDERARVLISTQLITEYSKQVLEPRNDFVSFFLNLLTSGSDRVQFNWAPWPGGRKAQQNACRFPGEDTHVLRTAFLESEQSTLYTEEERMLQAAPCVARNFGVHIVDPTC